MYKHQSAKCHTATRNVHETVSLIQAELLCVFARCDSALLLPTDACPIGGAA